MWHLSTATMTEMALVFASSVILFARIQFHAGSEIWGMPRESILILEKNNLRFFFIGVQTNNACENLSEFSKCGSGESLHGRILGFLQCLSRYTRRLTDGSDYSIKKLWCLGTIIATGSFYINVHKHSLGSSHMWPILSKWDFWSILSSWYTIEVCILPFIVMVQMLK